MLQPPRHADGALVVVTYGRTIDAELGETLGQIQAVQGRVLGVVLNRVPRVGNKYYYRGYYTSRSDDGSTKVKAARKSKRAKGRRRG